MPSERLTSLIEELEQQYTALTDRVQYFRMLMEQPDAIEALKAWAREQLAPLQTRLAEVEGLLGAARHLSGTEYHALPTPEAPAEVAANIDTIKSRLTADQERQLALINAVEVSAMPPRHELAPEPEVRFEPYPAEFEARGTPEPPGEPSDVSQETEASQRERR